MAAVPSAFSFARPSPLSVLPAPADPHPCPAAGVASGHRALDRELPHGSWPTAVLIELLLANPGVGELQLLAPTLSQLTRAGKNVILLAPSHIPLAAALDQMGIARQRVLHLEADKPGDRIWALEQAMKSPNFGALLCWLPQAGAEQLRRLQLAAAASDGLTFVFRPLEAREQSSPAPLRMVCEPVADGRLSVEIIKRRGPVRIAPVLLPLALPEPQAKPLARRAMTEPLRPFPFRTTSRGTTLSLVSRQRTTIAA